MLRLTSLGARLVLGVILVAALGLASADVATYASLRSFLFHRTDSALQSSHPEVEGAVLSPRSPGGPGPGPLGAAPGIDYVQVRALSGRIVLSRPVFQFTQEEPPPPPSLPSKVAIPKSPSREGERVTYFTVPAKSGGGRYRVRA